MIHPPPDIRSIVDKTAQFVARNGPEFEKRILANEKNNVKFNFLNSSDPYHAYYQHRVSEFKAQLAAPAQAPNQAAGATPAAAAPNLDDSGTPLPGKQAGADTAAVEVATKAPAKVIEPPEQDQYTVRLPEGITSLEHDIIKLTAQFVAQNGKSFLTGLTSREHANPQFNFLKPTHSMFTFFITLADAYSKVLMPPKGLVEKLKKDVDNKTAVLERCLHRLEWERSQERARQRAEDEIEQERLQMALIDWHDFVVVETIEFAEEEDDELPQPMTIEEVVRRSKALAAEEVVEDITEGGKEVEMEMDEEELHLVEEGMKSTTISDSNGSKGAEDAQPPPDDEDEAPMRIVTTWKRPEERLAAEKDPLKFVVSPITNELIPVNEMAEHMRISLIDPKYKEQKERMMAKLRETTLATDDEISRNIVGLARTRPDIFGTTEEEVSNAVKAEIEVKKEDPKQVIWDGHTGSISRTATQAMAQTMTLEEQIAAIHREKANLTIDGRPLPGPVAPPVPKLAATPARPPLPPPGLALNIPRPLNVPGQSVAASTPPLAPTPARPASLTTPPPLRPPPAPQTLPPGPPLIARPPAPMPPPPPVVQQPLGPPGGSMALYAPMPPPPRPFLPAMPLPPPPPQLSAMPPPPPPEEAPPPPPEEPEPKRQKVDEFPLIPEDQFLAQHPVCASFPHRSWALEKSVMCS
jgi:splicing factor 3A subunit 1